jgi:very-short-patch-repair endonuclease
MSAKQEYFLKSLSKIAKKKWEYYIISRVLHRLDDLEIEFACQKCFRTSDNKFYYGDLFFPQFNLYLEIDEPHHETDLAKVNDALRRFDIVEATGLEEVRIATKTNTIQEINKKVDEFITLLKKRKDAAIKSSTFRIWEFENLFQSEIHLKKGFVEIGPQSAFRTQRDALECFGYNKGHFQRGVWNLPPQTSKAIGLEGSCVVWFPRLIEQKDWNNSLSDDGKFIFEKCKNMSSSYTSSWDYRIVMARSRDSFNQTLYRFVGVFEEIRGESNSYSRKFRRHATRVNTI